MLMVNPLQCIRTSGNGPALLSAVASAHKRILASVEPVESAWYGEQFTIPVHFDAVFDIGFVPQQEKHRLSDVPYHFVFNGPTKREEQTIAGLSPPQKRSIRWALAGYPTAGRLALATQLTEEWDAGGFVFMPGKPGRPASDRSTWRPALARHEKISPSGLAAVLSETSYYVWTSAHDFSHYESLRFVAALRAGAVPCKLTDGGSSQELSQIPGSFSSVQSFYAAAQEEGVPSLYRLARDFYLSKGFLAAHLEEALELV